MSQYAEQLKTEQIDGEGLLSANDCELADMGVSNPLHCFIIKFLFKRMLLKKVSKHPQHSVSTFLNVFKLNQYETQFTDQRVDGDMLLEIIMKSDSHILEELGVLSAIDRLKIKAKIKPFLEPRQLNNMEKSAGICSVNQVANFLSDAKMDKYINTILKEDIDGEMLLAASNEELEDVLKVTSHLHRFKIQYLFRYLLDGSTVPYHPVSIEIENMVPKCAQEGIDSNMLQRIIQQENCDAILKELGVTLGNRSKIKKLCAISA